MAKERTSHFTKQISFGKDFGESLKMFEKMIREDKSIRNTIPKNMIKLVKKNGFFSYAIRYLINMYVERNKGGYLKKHSKINSKIIENDKPSN